MTTHVDAVTDVDAMGRAEAPGQRSLLRSVAMPAEHGSRGLTFEPVLLGLLLAAVELWFDMRSRSRRLLPELVGAIGMGGVAAVIVLAGGGSGRLAAACWMILAARSITAIVTVRDQVGGLHGRPGNPRLILGADLTAIAIATSALVVDRSTTVGAITVAAAIATQRALNVRPTPRAAVIGVRQTLIGLAVVAATAIGVLWT